MDALHYGVMQELKIFPSQAHVKCNVSDDKSSMSVKMTTSLSTPHIPYGLTKEKTSSYGTEIQLENTHLIHPWFQAVL